MQHTRPERPSFVTVPDVTSAEFVAMVARKLHPIKVEVLDEWDFMRQERGKRFEVGALVLGGHRLCTQLDFYNPRFTRGNTAAFLAYLLACDACYVRGTMVTIPNHEGLYRGRLRRLPSIPQCRIEEGIRELGTHSVAALLAAGTTVLGFHEA